MAEAEQVAGSNAESKAGSKKQKLVPVIVIGNKGTNKVVQYVDANGHTNRVYIPHAEEKDGKVPLRVLEAGVQFGLDWTQFIKEQTITPEQVASCLRSKNIWTLADLEANPTRAQGAIALVLNVNVARLRRLVRNDIKQKSGG